ncbi:MAG: hypothetical protein R2735_01375 [Microthrixaceae bacterium]
MSELVGSTLRSVLDPSMSSEAWQLLVARLTGDDRLTVASGSCPA